MLRPVINDMLAFVGRAIGRVVVNFESLVTPILRKRGCLAATAQVAAMVIPATGNPHGSFRWIDVTNLLFFGHWSLNCYLAGLRSLYFSV